LYSFWIGLMDADVNPLPGIGTHIIKFNLCNMIQSLSSKSTFFIRNV
jgi:hypothetical protein